jgi:hypothetical protein
MSQFNRSLRRNAAFIGLSAVAIFTAAATTAPAANAMTASITTQAANLHVDAPGLAYANVDATGLIDGVVATATNLGNVNVDALGLAYANVDATGLIDGVVSTATDLMDTNVTI